MMAENENNELITVFDEIIENIITTIIMNTNKEETVEDDDFEILVVGARWNIYCSWCINRAPIRIIFDSL
jgi:hypothetical protein